MILESIQQVNNKNLYICKTTAGVTIAVSYNTVIAAKGPEGILFLTSYSYSNTTAHHKTEASRILGGEVVEVTPEALYKIAAGDETTAARAIVEDGIKSQIIEAIQEDNRPELQDQRTKGNITPAKQPSKTTYKNGNSCTVYHYKTTFKYVDNIYYHRRTRQTSIKNKRGTYKTYKAVITS